MVDISGAYELESQKNIYEYMLSLGYPDVAAKDIMNEGKTITIKAGANHFSMKSFGRIVDFIYGEVTYETLPNGRPIESVAYLDGNVLKIKTIITREILQERVFTFSGSKLEVVVTNSMGVQGRRTYKRV